MTVSELKTAPGDLALLQGFVNTADRIHGTELLTGPKALGDWLRQAALLAPGVETTPADVERMLRLREDLRAWLAANNEVAMSDAVTERLDRAAEAVPLRLRVVPGGATRLEAGGGGLDFVVGRLFAIVHEARAEKTWPRLKACAHPDCRAAFHDFSPNRSGVWCEMRRCGNRVKVRAFARRHKHRGY